MHLFTALTAMLALLRIALAGANLPRQASSIPSSCPGVTARTTYKLSAATGWKYTLLASGFTKPRCLLFNTEGHLLVLKAGKGLTAHTLSADGCIASSKTVISMAQLNHGLALSPDGKTLYVSAAPTAWPYASDPKTMTATNQQVVVKGMNPGGYSSRMLAVLPNQPDLLIVSLGSGGNIDEPTIAKETGRAIVKVFDLGKAPAGWYMYNTQGWYLGYGLRNEVALVFDGNNMVWGVENSGDQLTRVTVGDPKVITDKAFKVGQQFMILPNATFDDASCVAKSVLPRLSIKAYSAPIDGKFDKAFANMYVSLHGSWNRQPATRYKVVQIPFQKLNDSRYNPVAPQDSAAGYSDVLWTQNEGGCSGTTCLRPTGITWHPDFSRMYVGSDGSVGEIYLLYKA
ncbi:L-sorbosone dehydrogenase [Staphylotrichum tortipilum]|uniref:L-sorbosone dehydrogenase n=1 Tax=Staphylotrichum tortipilum TaxID=2831512 RepID=A0AAN6MBD9_9PEZI|nr:L-sorbosone dehydrogenase [Staphylotrichum longicolle]